MVPIVVHVVLWGVLLLAGIVSVGVLFAAVFWLVALFIVIKGVSAMEWRYWIRVAVWFIILGIVGSMLLGGAS